MKLFNFNMQCRKVQTLLWDYAANVLTPDENQKVESHLASCNNCTKEINSISSLQKMLHNERAKPLPAQRHNFNEVQRALIVESSPLRQHIPLIASLCAGSAALAALLTFGMLIPLQHATIAASQQPTLTVEAPRVKTVIASIPKTIIKKVYIVKTIVKKPSQIELAAAYNQALLSFSIQHPEFAGFKSHFSHNSGAANLLTSYNHKITKLDSSHVSSKSVVQSHESTVVMMPVQHVTHYTTTILEPAVYDTSSTY